MIRPRKSILNYTLLRRDLIESSNLKEDISRYRRLVSIGKDLRKDFIEEIQQRKGQVKSAPKLKRKR